MTYLRCDVAECERLVILVDDVGRDGAVDDLVKDGGSVGVCESATQRCVASKTTSLLPHLTFCMGNIGHT